jgi:hypothetical protein
MASGFQLVEVQNHGSGTPRDADVKSERSTRWDGALECERAAACSVQGDRDCAIRVLCCLNSDATVPGSGKTARARVGEVGRPRGFYPERYSPLAGTSSYPRVHPSSTVNRPRRSRHGTTRTATRRAVRATRPTRSAIVASVVRTDGPRGGRRTEVRVRKSEHYAVEINPPDYCLDRPGMPVRREEIDPPSRALREALRQANFGPAGAQVDQWEAEQPALARFKDDGPSAHLARVAPQLRCLPSGRLPASLAGGHGGLLCRSHRASGKSVRLLELSRRAIFTLSTDLPTFGGAMLNPAPTIPSPAAGPA